MVGYEITLTEILQADRRNINQIKYIGTTVDNRDKGVRTYLYAALKGLPVVVL